MIKDKLLQKELQAQILKDRNVQRAMDAEMEEHDILLGPSLFAVKAMVQANGLTTYEYAHVVLCGADTSTCRNLTNSVSRPSPNNPILTYCTRGQLAFLRRRLLLRSACNAFLRRAICSLACHRLPTPALVTETSTSVPPHSALASSARAPDAPTLLLLRPR